MPPLKWVRYWHPTGVVGSDVSTFISPAILVVPQAPAAVLKFKSALEPKQVRFKHPGMAVSFLPQYRQTLQQHAETFWFMEECEECGIKTVRLLIGAAIQKQKKV